MVETQDTICAWAEAAFGAGGSDLRVAGRANEELAEAIRAVSAGKPREEIAVEIGDTMIVLCRLGKRTGITLLLGPYDKGQPNPHWRHPALTIAWANVGMALMIEDLSGGNVSSDTGAYLKEIWRRLHFAMQACGLAAQDVIDAKMKVNRARQWKADGTGHGYHVREKANG